MALKFLNKKGWHTGSLRNIENVWKAEQKHEAEQRKLEELRKQILEERERDEFRQLQEQAGLTPRQERLEFLYDSGLAVGKPSSDEFKAVETLPGANNETTASASASAAATSSVPGALFEEKPQSANDAWRKLHSDPLLMIRQREQEALARIKNNPVKMAMIRKSVETNKKKDEAHDGEHQKMKSKHKKHSSSKHHSDSENESHEDKERERNAKHKKKEHLDSDRSRHHRHSHKDHGSGKHKESRNEDREQSKRSTGKSRHEDFSPENRNNKPSDSNHTALPPRPDSNRRRGRAPQLSEEERAARLREMQADAEIHEEQRWKRLKKADEDDAREASHASNLKGRSFLDTAHKSVYGAEKGGSSTIEESVRRRSHYLQGRRETDERNAFRR